MDIGVFPWWTDPTLKAEFLQALTVLTHRLDYALWPDSPALMHAQSLFWLGTAVAAAAVFYRRMLGATWVAAVAALLFAVDDARGATVGFIANRNVLIAATFGVSALVCHDRWQAWGLAAGGVRWRRSCSPPHFSPRRKGSGRVPISPRTPCSPTRRAAGAAAWRCCPMPRWSSAGGPSGRRGVTASITWVSTSTR